MPGDLPPLAGPVPIERWNPELPAGTLRSISLHWTAGDYTSVFPAYHFCISGSAEPIVHATHRLQQNMRDLREAPPGTVYAAHTSGRNSFSVGIAVCAMNDARPDDFGSCPITAAQIHALCVVSERIAWTYRIPIAAIRTHAEAAVDDGYFGAIGDDRRWDIARVVPDARPLREAEATTIADAFRREIMQLRARRLEDPMRGGVDPFR